jgi:hypothetical protein
MLCKRPWAKSLLSTVPGQEGETPLHLMLREVKKRKRLRRKKGPRAVKVEDDTYE